MMTQIIFPIKLAECLCLLVFEISIISPIMVKLMSCLANDALNFVVVAIVCQFPVHANWFIKNNNQPKWQLKGSCPRTWMILCAVMLHSQFVGCMCGTSWLNIIPIHVNQQARDAPEQWFSAPKQKPSDALTRTVHMSFKQVEPMETTLNEDIFFDCDEDQFQDCTEADEIPNTNI